ncbi:MAG: glycosyltransferase family 2 protein [Spirochaetaceae bacterium]
MTAPLVSVVIPCYNRPTLVREAAESVLGQSFRDFELIVVDDGSTDGTPAVLEGLAAEGCAVLGPDRPAAPADAAGPDWSAGPPGPTTTPPTAGISASRITIRRIPHSGFPGAVRNRGVELARGRYVAFLDADDLWHAEKLDRQLQLHRAESWPRGTSYGTSVPRKTADSTSVPGNTRDIADRTSVPPRISHTRERWLRDGREISQKGMDHARRGWVFPDALKKCTIGPSTVMMERSLFEELGGFREDLEIAEDYELWLRVTAQYPVAYLDEPLTVKRAGHGDQLSRKYGMIEPFRIRALRDLVRSGFFEAMDGRRQPGFPQPGFPQPKAPAPQTSRAALARAELAQKCRIYATGCEKRGRYEEAAAYRAEAEEYEGS